jgi:hypothetical protein
MILFKKDDHTAKMALVFPGAIFYNVVILNILGVECHAGSG